MNLRRRTFLAGLVAAAIAPSLHLSEAKQFARQVEAMPDGTPVGSFAHLVARQEDRRRLGTEKRPLNQKTIVVVKSEHGWLPCDGREIDRAAYPMLFALLGTAYDEAGERFLLPDLRGEFLR